MTAALVPFIVGPMVSCAGSAPARVHEGVASDTRAREQGGSATLAATKVSREGTPANDRAEAPRLESNVTEAPPIPKLVAQASSPLPTSPFGVWAYVPWCDMVATGKYDSRVLVKPGHLFLGGCNAYRLDCDIEPPAIKCHRALRGLVACRAPEQLASDRRAAHTTDLAMAATSLRIEGRLLHFYAAAGSVLFSLHQFIEEEDCVDARAEP